MTRGAFLGLCTNSNKMCKHFIYKKTYNFVTINMKVTLGKCTYKVVSLGAQRKIQSNECNVDLNLKMRQQISGRTDSFIHSRCLFIFALFNLDSTYFMRFSNDVSVSKVLLARIMRSS